MNRLLGAGVLALFLVMAVAVGAADAKKVKWPRQVTMEFTRNLTGIDRFSGVVSSPNPACARGAIVKLHYRPANEGGGGGDVPPTTVATARADAHGNWAIDYEVIDTGSDFSTFAAHVDRNRLKRKKGRPQRVCKAAGSPTMTILNPQFL